MGGNILFPTMYQAVEKLMHCCDEISPIARSEVFNETWMLRLTLALLHDYTDVFSIEEGKKTIMEDIQKAVRKRWISEGGLHPAFENEGATWADAVVGDVDLGEEMKREIVVNTKNQPITGIIVIEAKIGSKLSEGITHEKKNYNQAARNIACLARLVHNEGEELISKSRFFVFGPTKKVKNWKGCQDNQKLFGGKSNEESTLLRQIEGRAKEFGDESFFDAVKEVFKRSAVISWEDVINSMQNEKQYENLKLLAQFYCRVLHEADKKCQLPKDLVQKFDLKV